MQASNSAPKPAAKARRDSGLADTSDAETDKQNGSNPSSYESEQPNKTSTSMLNIVDNDRKQDKPAIWKTTEEDGTSDSKPQRNPVTTESIKHQTDFYDPENLNQGQYLEVKFKNDLIFDLDM